jgi:threonine aldolase
VVAEVREWRHRLGGTLYGLWPNAASALTCLRERLPRMPSYLAHARAIADAVREIDGVTVVPDPPQTSMLHLLLRVAPDRFTANARRIAQERSIWTWQESSPTDDPTVQKVELSVGDASCALEPATIRDAVAALLE